MPPATPSRRTRFSKTSTTARIIVVRDDPALPSNCDTPEAVLDYWRATVASQPDYEPDKESLVVILLNTRLRAFAWHRVSLGTLNETVAHPREILRPVIVGGAHSFILAHNHPSGDPSPSRSDRELTTRIAQAAELLQVKLIDHVIVAESGPATTSPYFSFQEAGML